MNDQEPTIESNIRDFRKKHHLSQEELADKLNISRQSVIALEQGKTLPSLPLVVSMCQFFDTDFEELFDFHRQVEREIDKAFDNNFDNIKVITNPDQGRKEHMVDLEPWRPFREAVSLRDAMDRLFEDSFITPAKISGGMPKVDVRDLKDSVVVRAELPGVKEEEVDVEILDNVMTISGEKKEEKEELEENPPAGGGYYYKESHTGKYSRSFTLPSDVKAEEATAEMKDGVLTIRVPKIEPKKAKKVTVSKK
ncbi:MAG: Hsp20 family protein [Patescibacteria group bacterium]